ncbi:MAG: cobalamin B12-binding domain-containing protein [Roseovarius confluentis]
MTDGPEPQRSVSRLASDQSVESLANQALNLLAKKRFAKPRVLSKDFLNRLRFAAVDRDSDLRFQVVSEMRAGGIPPEDIADLYIPEIARQLGAQWCEDGLGFADVTIGTARLQSLLREISTRFHYPTDKRNESGIAVVVLADEYHTLGAMVLTSQLRRLGISVRLLLGVSQSDALRELQQDRYDAVMISASHIEGLDKLAKFVEKIRKQTRRNTPIVIGGPILGSSADVKAITGADVATADVYEAIRECRLRTFHAGVPANPKGT